MAKLWREVRALAASRRVVVLLGAGLLFALRWKLSGRPEAAEWASFLAVVAAWLRSESERRHDGSIARSRRLIVGLLSQVVPAVLALAGVAVPAEALAGVNGLVASWLLGEGARRHETSAEDAPPKP